MVGQVIFVGFIQCFKVVPSSEVTYPLLEVAGKMIFFFHRWDMLVPRRV